MPKTFLKKSTGWTEMKSIFVKKSTGWTETKSIFIKKLVGGVATWVKVYTKASLPDTTTSPSIRTTNTGSGTVYDGPAAESPRFLNDNLFGKDGRYTNYTSIFGRKFTSATTAAALPSERSTVVAGDLFTSGGGVTTTDRTNLDNKYLFYELTVQNGSSANQINSISSPIKMIKSQPALGTGTTAISGNATANSVLTFNYSLENYYYNKLEQSNSKIRWWRSNDNTASGTLLKEETLTGTVTSSSSSLLSGSSTYTIHASNDNDKYIVVEIIGVSSWTINNSGSTDYQVVKKSVGPVTSPYVFTFGNILHIGTNGYISLDSGNSSDTVSSTTGRVIGIFPVDLVQATTTSIWYWSNTTQFIIRWEGYVYGNSSNLREYEVVFDINNNYVSVYAINVTSGASGTQAYLKDGIALTSYSAALTTGNFRYVYFNTATSPTTQFGPYVTKSKSVMKQVTGLTIGGTDVGYTSITTSTNQNVTPSLGAFNVSSFTKGTVGSSSQGATRSTTLSWESSSNATRYEIQYQGSNDNVNWTTVQTYAASSYNTSTSETKTWSTSGGNFSFYTFMRANIRASESTATAAYVYSNSGSYVEASGTAPGQPTFGTITKTATTASIPVTAGSQGTNYRYEQMEYMYRTDAGAYGSTWSSQTLSTGTGTIPLTGLTGSTKYWIKIRNRNYDELYSSENETNFTTDDAVTIPTNATAPTLSGGLNVGDTFTFGVGTWNNTPTSYSLRLYRGTASVVTSETLVKDAGNVTSSTYTILASDYTSTPTRLYFRAFASATNSAGTSGSPAGTLTPGAELGPITNTVASKPPAPTVNSNNSLSYGGTFSWSSTGATGYVYTVYGPSGTSVFSTNGAAVTTTSWAPPQDGTWAGAGTYTIYIFARNAAGDSSTTVRSQAMS